MDGIDSINLDLVIGNIGDYTDDAILITEAEPVDLPGPRIVWVNKAFTKMTGYSLDEVYGETPRVLQGDDTNPAALLKIRTALKAWKPVRVELKNYRKDSTPFWVDLAIQPITERSGRHRYWIAIQRETTERHSREQLLYRTTEIIESAPIALGLLTADNRITFANEHFKQLLFGEQMSPALPLPYESWLRHAIADHGVSIMPDSNPLDWLQRHLGGVFSAPSRVDQRVRGRWHEFRRVATKSGDQLVIGEDIEDRILLQEQLRHLTKIDAMGQLTSGVAHDFNNLLAVILGNVELLQKDASNEDDRDLFISETIDAVLRGRSLTQSLLSFARKSQLDPKSSNVGDLCQQTMTMFRRTCGASLQLNVAVAEQLPNINVDRNLFQNALLNLLINARDAVSQNGKIEIEVRLADAKSHNAALFSAGADPLVEVIVRDDGDGIENEIIQKVFEPFFTTKEVGDGSGLGLSMVHGFVKQSGGNLDITSDAGFGTSVQMLFPADYRDKECDEVDSMHDQFAQAVSVLLIEDEPSLRSIFENYLKSMGAEVTSVVSGDAAMILIDQWSDFDILLTDLVMPGLIQGDALAREFRDRCPKTPIVILSGNPEIADMMNSNYPNEYLVLTKPIRRAAFMSQISTALKISSRQCDNIT